ncbi:MAG: ribonuclease HI family protein [Armatimonadetes bacterium]|nr:ribonuclease HI family protein [Armatimonadota bacterium]
MSGPGPRLVAYIDGASRGNPGPAAIGVVIQHGQGRVLREIAEYLGETTNNVAEYRALLRALAEAEALGAAELVVLTDSELLARQLQGQYRVRSAALTPLFGEAMARLRRFHRAAVRHVPRRRNAAADALANRALDQARRP